MEMVTDKIIMHTLKRLFCMWLQGTPYSDRSRRSKGERPRDRGRWWIDL
jgi:hypothetical protein